MKGIEMGWLRNIGALSFLLALLMLTGCGNTVNKDANAGNQRTQFTLSGNLDDTYPDRIKIDQLSKPYELTVCLTHAEKFNRGQAHPQQGYMLVAKKDPFGQIRYQDKPSQTTPQCKRLEGRHFSIHVGQSPNGVIGYEKIKGYYQR
jgi:hypothetical protein